MSSANTFLTESLLPTLESFDWQQAKRLRDLCKEMEGLMGQTSEKIGEALQNQQSKFIKAIKTMLDQFQLELRELKKRFDDYVEYHKNETELINTQNKLDFFRKECQVLSGICKDLKSENAQLKRKIVDLKNDLQFHHAALLKQTTRKQDLYQQLQRLKEANKPILLQLKQLDPASKSKQSRTLSTQLKYNQNTRTPQQSLNKTYDDQSNFYSQSYEHHIRADFLDTASKHPYDSLQQYTNEFII